MLPDLPFAKDALDPHMSAETLEFHHGKHHKAYVNKTNELIAERQGPWRRVARSRSFAKPGESGTCQAVQQQRAAVEPQLLLAMPCARAKARSPTASSRS